MTLVLHTFRPPWMGSRGRVAEGWVGSLVCGKRERVCRNRAGELVSKLLHLHFKDDKTKVSGDALQLMAELLKIFVVGEQRDPAVFSSIPPRPVRIIHDRFAFYFSVGSGHPQRPAGPGRGPGPSGCGTAGEGAASAASGLLGVSTLTVATAPRHGLWLQTGQELLMPQGSPPAPRIGRVPAKHHSLPPVIPSACC
ncbi:centromere protein X isoform X1 [Tursiops truncatus]|uniref:Centromere protein X isoform X1 n=1 Tax=Tursiops truncatus TaxID=9739 RepID=A0A6J3QN04_TURTR|nr:centromere protein X isoform X1 [Tursiops truncatus]